MTFIQPNKNSALFRAILTVLVIGLVVGTFCLIMLYNHTVAMSQEITAAKAELDTIGAKNTALNNQIVTTLGSADQMTAIAAQGGLVMDAKPQYVSAAQ